MSVRVQAIDVKAIMDNCTLDDNVVDTFVVGASAIVDNVFATNTTLGAAMLKEIERWLAAHMIASTIQRTASDEKVGDASMKYTGQWGKKLESTSYGQMVLSLDTTGLISRAGKQAASIRAVESFDD